MSLDRILIIDTESSGLDPLVDHLVEVACIQWSVTHACALTCWSALVQASSNAAEAINGIPAAALSAAQEARVVFEVLKQGAENCDVIVAHNATHDRNFLPPLGKPWVCSMEDIQWPGAKPGGFTSVIDLALANGLAVLSAHRALSDCLLLSRLFERMVEKGVDVQAMMARAMRPKGLFVSLAPFAQKDVVKAHGFKWFGEDKEWRRRMFLDDVAALPFKVRQLGG